MRRYKSVENPCTVEQMIEKSRFICHIKPVGSKEEAEAFISAIRAEYKDAAHNVPAYVLGENSEGQWASDDGEPSGTSGAPILHMLVKEDLTNLAVVVTRYFGGIKLGTGGLVRAYTSTVKMGLEASGISRYEERTVFLAKMSYAQHGKLQSRLESQAVNIRQTRFDDGVSVELSVAPSGLAELKKTLLDLTAGTCEFFGESTEMTKV